MLLLVASVLVLDPFHRLPFDTEMAPHSNDNPNNVMIKINVFDTEVVPHSNDDSNNGMILIHSYNDNY